MNDIYHSLNIYFKGVIIMNKENLLNKENLQNFDGDVLCSIPICDKYSITSSNSTIPLYEETKVVCILGEPIHATEIKKVKAYFVKKGCVVITNPYDVNDINDIDCMKKVVENSICIANLIYVVNVDGIDSITENYIKFAKTLNKKIEYHLQKEMDLSTYFAINKNRLIDEINDTYSNLIRITKAIESIIGKMVKLSDDTNWIMHPYNGKIPVIQTSWSSIVGPVTAILWNGYSFNITTDNSYINGITQHIIKLDIVYPDCNLYGISNTATLNIKIDEHTYRFTRDETNDPEIELTVCKIFDAVIEEFKVNIGKDDE